MPARLLTLSLVMIGSSASAADPFRDTIVPFLKSYCVDCHNDKKSSGDLNLTKSLMTARPFDDFRQWEHVLRFVKREEMPPAKSKQPTVRERSIAVAALEQLMQAEARKLAGDPGIVLPRRLSNAEYDYTIRDITGADIRAAKTFPVDPASGEGFNNTGEALNLSPGLFKKYYSAAEIVAEHAILTTIGLRFAPHPMVSFADRQNYYEQAILRFYEHHDIDHEKYLCELWLFQHQPSTRKRFAREEWVKAKGLSAKHFAELAKVLDPNADPDATILGWLQRRWKALPPVERIDGTLSGTVRDAIRTLAIDAAKLGKELSPKETEAIVAHAGNGPIDHLARRRKTAAERGTFDPANLPKVTFDLPNLPRAGETPSAALLASGAAFCRLFPNRFVQVDHTRGLSAGFHLLEGFFRDDRPLCQWVLSDAENAELDALWDELEFVTGIWEKMLRGFVFFERSERNFLKHADFDPFREEDPFLTTEEVLSKFQQTYLKRAKVTATGDALAQHPVTIFFTDIRNGLFKRTERLKKLEPRYLDDVQAFAERAYRRPLTDAERTKLTRFFTDVAAAKNHGLEAAVRNSIVRILVSPQFTMRLDIAPAGDTVAPLPTIALASRLSYFIWSGPPDTELLALAKTGKLREPKILREQVQRMIQDPKVSRFAQEFFGQWFGYRDFLTQEQVNRQTFPSFDDTLRQSMFEEPTRLAAHLIQSDQPITRMIDGDSTFVNRKLAEHYGFTFKGRAEEWELVSGLREKGRGGVLGMAVFLTRNSQPQRTSPVKRGFWVVHKVLGEHIPPPPPDVAVLPAKESDTNGRTIRELLKLHVSDAKCAGCHVRFDSIGLAMEGFDPIGRVRSKDLAGRPVDNAVTLPSGMEAKGVPALADHLATARKADFEQTLCRKFLGYALGRSLQLSDQPLLKTMHAELVAGNDRLSTLFELVALSPQFRMQRCKDFNPEKFQPESYPGDRR